MQSLHRYFEDLLGLRVIVVCMWEECGVDGCSVGGEGWVWERCGVDGCNVGGEGWMWMGVVWVVRGGCGRSVGVDGRNVGGGGWA